MTALIAHLKLDLKNVPEVQNLIAEADMAVQILATEEGEVVEAVKEGLESALDNLKSEGAEGG